MARRIIVNNEDLILRQISKPVTEFNSRLGELIDDMRETMFSARGAGLAAVQVGVLLRVAVVCTDGETVYELINPVIIKQSGSRIDTEGCLSIPGRNGYVERPERLIADGVDRNGKPVRHKINDAYTAVAFCHEIDHLNGILFTDRIIPDYKPKKNTGKNTSINSEECR
jgi:peptide deformylase